MMSADRHFCVIELWSGAALGGWVSTRIHLAEPVWFTTIVRGYRVSLLIPPHAISMLVPCDEETAARRWEWSSRRSLRFFPFAIRAVLPRHLLDAGDDAEEPA